MSRLNVNNVFKTEHDVSHCGNNFFSSFFYQKLLSFLFLDRYKICLHFSDPRLKLRIYVHTGKIHDVICCVPKEAP